MNDSTWAALTDSNRRAMLDLLRRGPCTVGEVSASLRLSQPATSKHLKVLRQAGLVHVRQRAQQRIYAVDPRPIAELDKWLAPYRALWNPRLEELGRHLDGMEQP